MRDLSLRVEPRAPSMNRAKARTRKLPLLTRGRLILGAGSLLGLLVLALAWSGWFGRTADRVTAAWLETTAEAGLAVEEVLLTGRKRTSKQALRDSIGVRRGTPMLAIDPQAAKERIEALPWVATAMVERRLPNVLRIEITERQPLALWQHRGRKVVIDRDGEVIAAAQPTRFATLPLVVGEGAPAHTAALLAVLAREPQLQPLVVAAIRVGERRWNLRLRGGIDVRLPADDVAAAWGELARLQREYGLLQREIMAIDLRLSDRMVLRMAPGLVPAGAAKGPGEDT
ncbi:MAG: FtsQ-type POTRA domain-containing protein [Kiloniellales bacterium]|nr:FtsQ-type POTRA domain-containing protein [Kiloniellales bacterium]